MPSGLNEIWLGRSHALTHPHASDRTGLKAGSSLRFIVRETPGQRESQNRSEDEHFWQGDSGSTMRLRPGSQGKKQRNRRPTARSPPRLGLQAASSRGLDAEGRTESRADRIELDPILAASLCRAQRQDLNIRVLIFDWPDLQGTAVAIDT